MDHNPLIVLICLAVGRDRPEREPGFLGAYLDETPIFGQGVAVIGIRSGSAAEAGGLIEGDVITSVNGRTCRECRDLDAVMLQATVGSRLSMLVTRDGKSKSIAVSLKPFRK